MKFLEKDLETIIFENYHACIDRGLGFIKNKFIVRQVNLSRYGIADLISFEVQKQINFETKILNIHIYELKQDKINISTYTQCARYIVGVRKLLSQFNLKNTQVIIKGIIIGKEIEEDGDFVWLIQMQNNIEAFTYDYEVNGISFDRVGDYFMKNNTPSCLSKATIREIVKNDPFPISVYFKEIIK